MKDHGDSLSQLPERRIWLVCIEALLLKVFVNILVYLTTKRIICKTLDSSYQASYMTFEFQEIEDVLASKTAEILSEACQTLQKKLTDFFTLRNYCTQRHAFSAVDWAKKKMSLVRDLCPYIYRSGSRQHSHAQLLDILTCLTYIREAVWKQRCFLGKNPPSLVA